MLLYYLILWNQVDILQKHFKKDHVHMRLWTRFTVGEAYFRIACWEEVYISRSSIPPNCMILSWSGYYFVSLQLLYVQCIYTVIIWMYACIGGCVQFARWQHANVMEKLGKRHGRGWSLSTLGGKIGLSHIARYGARSHDYNDIW